MTPTDAMISDLRRDYGAMAGMIFGDVPDFDAVLVTVETPQRSLNEPRLHNYHARHSAGS